MSRYYLVTLPAGRTVFAPNVLPDDVAYMKGQLELGAGGLLHWQFVVGMIKECRASLLKKIWPMAHIEKTRSQAANEYVWKDDTAVEDTRFELGELPKKRNSQKDWEDVWQKAKKGQIEEIPVDIRIRSYKTLKQIEKDYMKPGEHAVIKTVYCYWGKTGTGKSHRAWEQAGWDAYPKTPTNIFWDGYQGQENVVFDEFRGMIGISHLLRWFDKYPCCIDIKFGGAVLKAKNIWITSNLDPREWYPDLDVDTRDSLLRRMKIIHFGGGPFQPRRIVEEEEVLELVE